MTSIVVLLLKFAAMVVSGNEGLFDVIGYVLFITSSAVDDVLPVGQILSAPVLLLLFGH
jgi:hypothetical protein